MLPTLDLGRAALKQSYTWHYSTQGLPVADITTHYRELLPHIFTITAILPAAVIFCGTISFLLTEAGYSPVGCSILSGLSSSCLGKKRWIGFIAKQRYTLKHQYGLNWHISTFWGFKIPITW